jgi:hypothetical protein
VDDAFSGVWLAVGLTEMEGRSPAEMSLTLHADVDGDGIEVRGFCSDGSGEAWGRQYGDVVQFGTATCPAIGGDCPDAVFYYDNGNATMRDGILTLHFNGQYVGCGDYVRPVHTVLTGRKAH